MSKEQRAALGRQRVGEPIANVIQAFVPALLAQPWAEELDAQAVLDYVNNFLFGAFVQLIDESTEDLASLEAIEPEGVQRVVLLLLRDVVARSLMASGGPGEEATMRSDGLIEQVAQDVGVSAEPVRAPALPLDTDDLGAPWAGEAMEAIGLTARHGLILVVAHAAFVDAAWAD